MMTNMFSYVLLDEEEKKNLFVSILQSIVTVVP